MQTGFGRTGDTFWGFEDHGIKPDIVTLAKGIGNGFPLAAVITTPKIAAALKPHSYFNTFGGNPVACAAGIAVLDVSYYYLLILLTIVNLGCFVAELILLSKTAKSYYNGTA